jgi:hypothetical protein
VFFTIFDKKKYSNYADLKKKKIENLLHWNYWANLNQTLLKRFLGGLHHNKLFYMFLS